jgi:hypothetical protein
MAKKVEKKNTVKTTKTAEKNTVPVAKADTKASPFANLTSTEMLARIRSNVKERKRLAAENKELQSLYKGTKSLEKTASTEARIKALTAQLEVLKNPPAVKK